MDGYRSGAELARHAAGRRIAARLVPVPAGTCPVLPRGTRLHDTGLFLGRWPAGCAAVTPMPKPECRPPAPTGAFPLGRLRVAAGLYQHEVAARLGVARGTYGLWESGGLRPSLARCVRIAAVLGCPVAAVLAAVGLGEGSEEAA